MYCKKCGTEQRVDEKYCRKCGTLYPVSDSISQDKAVNDDLSKSTKENDIPKERAESQPEVIPASQAETVNDIKNESNNEKENSTVEELQPTEVLTEEQIRCEKKVAKMQLLSKSVAILACAIFLIFKAGFSASIGWWILSVAIVAVAFMTVDHFEKKDVAATRGFYACVFLSAILILFGPSSGSGGGSRSIEDIAGTYTFGHGSEFELVINDDGRVWTLFDDYSGEVCGEVYEIAEEGFSIDVNPIGKIYHEGGATGLRRGGILVFNTEERKLYFEQSDYNNRDVEKVTTASFSYSPRIKRIKK